jgi:hypothetical protein
MIRKGTQIPTRSMLLSFHHTPCFAFSPISKPTPLHDAMFRYQIRVEVLIDFLQEERLTPSQRNNDAIFCIWPCSFDLLNPRPQFCPVMMVCLLANLEWATMSNQVPTLATDTLGCSKLGNLLYFSWMRVLVSTLHTLIY